MRIDLHLHTNASDGQLSPTELVRAARLAGLDLIAITDHDTVAGVEEALRAAGGTPPAGEESGRGAGRPLVIPGIEVSSTYAGTELHFLGYFVDHRLPLLTEFAATAAERRSRRILGMIERLARLGIEIEYDDVVAAAGSRATTLGRPHLARAMVARGYVATTNDAFERYLGDDGPAFIPTDLLTPQEAIELIEAAGGIAIWAHPPRELVETELEKFVEWGLQGLECHRPRNTTSNTHFLLYAADAYDLLITGGSDWHGDWNGPLGSFSVGEKQIEEFLRETGVLPGEG